ncbi:YqaJ viral recombinase family protein [Aquamicrobium defluvii]|uniref:YqaJ-like recombinase protein n=1 Tax=Aquamicrobium defluvii TaxID=69279 RepID=A0A4R6YES2_9HYPH|nr:YqaJ viral recombinase family protein [Aquamicrobium defluvii]TDR34700.1 YqaJ-like recombinase protein [Aquamicrobium defluvii]
MSVQVILPADRAAWLDARKQDVTASVAGALLGIHPYQTPYGLWAEKSGRVASDDTDNPVLRRGRLLEPVVIEMLREDRPDWTVEYRRDNAYYRHVEHRIGATPDAFATRPDIYGRGIVQVKTVADDKFRREWIDADTGEVVLPLWIAVQAIVEATLTESTWACVAVMVIGRGIDLQIVDVPLNTRVMNRLRREVREFWRMVEECREPSIDWNRDGASIVDVYRDSMPDRKDLTQVIGLDGTVCAFWDARQDYSHASKIMEATRPRILHALGAAEAGFTKNWNITARTSVRTGPNGQPVKSRSLRISPKENPDARF